MYTNTKSVLIPAAILLAVPTWLIAAEDLRHPSSLNSFCVDPVRDGLCPNFPDDQTDFSDKFVYMLINVETQTPFDVFSWQAFAALNWEDSGLPEPAQSQWDGFRRREEVFATDEAMQVCGNHADGAGVITADLVQADGNVLIDQAGNFVVFETRINAVAEAYILDNALQTMQGQVTRGAEPVEFPMGREGDDGTPASILIKTSWRVLPPDAAHGDYIVRPGLIHVPARHSETGRDMCLRETLGMIGMHIVTRTHSGNGDEWLWSTFEHRLTAPTAANTREVNSIYSLDLFPGGCAAPEADGMPRHILFDPECPDCPTNIAPGADWLWAERAPYARLDGSVEFTPPQIVRCWEIFEGTRELNEMWQAELMGTPLAQYQLISTQWRGADKSPLFEHGEVPRFLTNTTMESYQQADDDGTCMGCHAEADSAVGGDANFTFLLREAQ